MRLSIDLDNRGTARGQPRPTGVYHLVRLRPSNGGFIPLACPRGFASPARTHPRSVRTHDTDTKPKPISRWGIV
eukprot:8765715-Alexandrium_andersonii.AAC.1